MSHPPTILIVGGGPAGLSAAAAAAEVGASVMLCEEQPTPGGQLIYRAQPVDTGSGGGAERPEILAKRLVEAALSAGAVLKPGMLVAGRYGGGEILLVGPGRTWTVTPDALILATGSTDLPFPFPGATSPGVFSCRAVKILLNQWRVLPGRRFAIVGAGADAEELAVDILLAGGEVVWSGIAPPPLFQTRGRDGVETLSIGPSHFEVDVIAIAVGRQADFALAAMSGAKLGFAPELGGWFPVADDRMQCPEQAIFVAGDAAGIGSVAVAMAEGRLAGLAAAASLGLTGAHVLDEAREAGGVELAWRGDVRRGLEPSHVQPFT